MNINATLLAQAVVFVIFVVICMKYVYPQILAVMQEREKRISDGLEAAKKADDSLEEAKLASDKELNKAKEEAADILKKANARASQIVADASSKAEAEAEKIMTAASASVESETNRAKEELRQQMSDIIIDTTEKILGDEISSEKHNDILKKGCTGALMIELTPLARPYAKAIFAAALDDKSLEETSNELHTITLVTSSPEVTNAIEDPKMSRKQVVDLLMELFSKEVSQKSEKLLLILAENKRLNLLKTIYQLYVELVREHKSQKSIEVFVASDPSEDAKEKIETKLYASYGDDAKITFLKDPKIMGGLTIKVGDETLDLSIRGKVNKLANQLNF